jgi:NAD(P)-dependent dehydrogenase (short-subunit alcohol dehydrogenase family)
MHPKPVTDPRPFAAGGKLVGKTALITGGDSGIGKAVALLFAKEGADIAITYLNEHKDARDTQREIADNFGRQCLLFPGDITREKFCISTVGKVMKRFGKIDILVNNAAIHYEHDEFTQSTTSEMMKTFSTNVFAMFWFTKAVVPYMHKGNCIINTTSVTAYRGSASLVDYSATKGAIVSFTRSLSANLMSKGIRVNAVAPGPIWTPLIAASFKPHKVAKHGGGSPMGRPGEPAEVAPAFLFLASEDSSYITGQVIHPNGGEIVNG